MKWIQVLIIALVNMLSVFISVAAIRWYQNRQRLKLVESFVSEIEQKIKEEVNFSEIVKDFYGSDMED
jgi:hypothetical protein